MAVVHSILVNQFWEEIWTCVRNRMKTMVKKKHACQGQICDLVLRTHLQKLLNIWYHHTTKVRFYCKNTLDFAIIPGKKINIQYE